MESIRMLQDTYERLYAITSALGDFLETEFERVSPLQWRENYVAPFLQSKKKFDAADDKNWRHLHEIDSYYLLELLKKYWDILAERTESTFFTKENRNLFVNRRNKNSLIFIRNEVAHPRYWDYTIEEYNSWTESLKKAAEIFGQSMSELIGELHETEKRKLLDIIRNRVINPALKSDIIPESLLKHIRSTKERLETQNTAAGIMAFFMGAFRSETGKEIYEFFKSHKMESFESIEQDVRNAYYGI
ncbi:MAG: hypothetical protein HDR38_01760 [Treponema sp.]|nr:hypothetical protein [Treponema sp.]MDE6736321.1 hypothetical protein [Treponemataceae bacterium]